MLKLKKWNWKERRSRQQSSSRRMPRKKRLIRNNRSQMPLQGKMHELLIEKAGIKHIWIRNRKISPSRKKLLPMRKLKVWLMQSMSRMSSRPCCLFSKSSRKNHRLNLQLNLLSQQSQHSRCLLSRPLLLS